MNTLSNVNDRRGGTNPPYDGLTSNVILEVQSHQQDEKHPPVVVPYYEMLNFIKLTSVDNEHIKLVEPERCHYKSGDKVRIVEGDFAGVVGRVARISGQQRVVVEINGLCMVATAYIPSAFLVIYSS